MEKDLVRYLCKSPNQEIHSHVLSLEDAKRRGLGIIPNVLDLTSEINDGEEHKAHRSQHFHKPKSS